MVDPLAATLALCAATASAAALATLNVLHRRQPPEAAPGRDGLAIFWLGYGLLFGQSALVLALGPALHERDAALMLVVLGAVAFCLSGAGLTVHILYLWRGRTAWPSIAGAWALLLCALLVGNVLYPPEGYLAADAGPVLRQAVSPPWWLTPTVGTLLALPAGVAAFLYLAARRALQGSPRVRAAVHAWAFAAAAAWTWWTIMVAGVPALGGSTHAVFLARVLGVLPPFLMWASQLLNDPPPDRAVWVARP